MQKMSLGQPRLCGIPQVRVKCPVVFVSVPMLEKQRVTRDVKRKRLARLWSMRARRRGKITKDVAKKVTFVQWPVFNPATLFKALIEADALSLLQGPEWDWGSFWERASREDWGCNHPVLGLAPEMRACAVACSLHGDEGQGKRKRNVLVLSWSSLAVHGPSERTKFLFSAPRSFCARLSVCTVSTIAPVCVKSCRW